MGGLKLEFHWLTVLLFLLRCFRSESTLTSLDLLCVEREERVCVCVYCREDKVLLCDDVGIGVGVRGGGVRIGHWCGQYVTRA